MTAQILHPDFTRRRPSSRCASFVVARALPRLEDLDSYIATVEADRIAALSKMETAPFGSEIYRDALADAIAAADEIRACARIRPRVLQRSRMRVIRGGRG